MTASARSGLVLWLVSLTAAAVLMMNHGAGAALGDRHVERLEHRFAALAVIFVRGRTKLLNC